MGRSYYSVLLSWFLFGCGGDLVEEQDAHSVVPSATGGAQSATASGSRGGNTVVATAVAGGTGGFGGGASQSTGGTAGTSVATGTGGTAGSTTIEAACTPYSPDVGWTVAPAVVEFVFDNHLSMSSTAGDVSKWQAWNDAFAAALSTLATEHTDAAVGLTYFHTEGNGAGGQSSGCNDGLQAVAMAPLTNGQVTLLSTDLSTRARFDGRPTQDSWQFAADYARSTYASDATYANSRRNLVLVTDGVPDVASDCAVADGCSSELGSVLSDSQYQALIDAVAAYKANFDVTTFVVALPHDVPADAFTCSGSAVTYAPLEQLAAVATAGGTALVDLTLATDLTAQLQTALETEIGAGLVNAVACASSAIRTTDNYGNELFFNPSQVTVAYYPAGGTSCTSNGDCATDEVCGTLTQYPNHCYREVPRSDDCSNPEGWYFTTDEDGNGIGDRIALCQDACANLRADSAARLDVIAACYPIG